MATPMSTTPLLVEGETCWRRVRARRAAFLVDGAAYFDVLATALERAERQVVLVGWDFHSRTRLRRRDGEDAEADALAVRLDAAARRRPELRIHVLCWDFAPLYALEREALPELRFGFATHERVRFHLDDRHPLGASQHQKLVVVDDALAFCGGLDVTACRWDTPEHAAGDPRRRDPGFGSYPPFHDVQMAVDGEAAGALGELVRERWRRATGESLPVPEPPATDPWPPELAADAENVAVGIARTEPAFAGRRSVREVEALWIAAVRAARRHIYIENQYLTAQAVREALAERLGEPEGPEVVVVSPRTCSGWLEETTMGVLRARWVQRLREADRFGRLRLYCPRLPGAEREDLNVHAKVLVVDERLARVGSANLSNRSLGFDSECDLALDADGDEGAERAVAGLRDRLLAEHLGTRAEAVAEALGAKGSLGEAVEALRGAGRTLEPLETEVPPWMDELIPAAEVADPERPAALEDVLGELAPAARRTGPWVRAAGGLLFAVALAAAWVWTPLGEWTHPGRLVDLAAGLRGDPTGIAVGIAAVALGGLVMLPITALTAAAALIFGWAMGAAVALVGAALGACAGYALGQVLWRDAVRRLAGRRLHRVSEALGRRGLLSAAAIRLVPLAPFTVVNVVAGASHIRFRDFALGTVLGMAPGTALLALLTDRTAAALREPDPGHLALAALAAVLLVGASLALRHLLVRRSRDTEG